MTDYIYAMGKPDGSSPMKIGRTKALQKRLSAVRVHCPFPVDCHSYIAVSSGVEIEKHVKDLMKSHHVHREWYDVTADKIKEIFASIEESPPEIKMPYRHDRMGRPKTGYCKSEYNKQYARDARAIKALGLSISVSEWREMNQGKNSAL